MPKLFCRIAAVTLGLLFFAAPALAEELIGTWLTQQADAHIRVAKCGKAVCGAVVWLKDPIDPKTAQPHYWYGIKVGYEDAANRLEALLQVQK